MYMYIYIFQHQTMQHLVNSWALFLISDLNMITTDIPFARFLNVPIEQSISKFEDISFQMAGLWYLIMEPYKFMTLL